MKVITRFAPSPTGFLHIGGARTALFNWLYARSQGGEFILRIEDTDKKRNNDETIEPIISGMAWLGLDHDGEIVYQSERADRHVEVAQALLASGHAYRDYDSVETKDRDYRKTVKTVSPWRDITEDRFDGRGGAQIPYVVRLKMPLDGTTVINDIVQGAVEIANDTLDDYIILRSDGTPTYMLAVVVDDHDAGVTHVIRGDDHLNNAFRQLPIYRAMGWDEPAYAHLPLIFDENGKKLSKRHGAAGLETYRDTGYLPDTVFNYLLRMGWGHGDHEIVSRDEALKLFTLDAVGKAPARIDQKRLDHLNGVYIRSMSDEALYEAVWPLLIEKYVALSDDTAMLVKALVPIVKERCKTTLEARSYISMVLERPGASVEDTDGILLAFNNSMPIWEFTAEALKVECEGLAEKRGMKLKHIVAPIRLAITGSKISPPLFESMAILGHDECRERILFAITGKPRMSEPGWHLMS